MVNELVPHDKHSAKATVNQPANIRKSTKRLAWVLSAGLAAAGTCWGGPFAGQNQNQTSDGKQVIAVTAAQAHEWEMQVELCLLADPLTFPYPLKPQITQSGMELKGSVPNVWIRDHALKVAKGVCQVAVVDAMAVNPKMAIALPRMQTATFATEARQKLEHAGVKLSSPVEITAPGSGQIVLAGHIESAEDKLKMSRSLRGLTGCTCVKNDLVVSASPASAVELVKHVEPAKAAHVVKDAAKVEAAKAPAVYKENDKSEPVKTPSSDLVRRMPASPVTPMKGTLQKEAEVSGGVSAVISFDDDEKPSGVVHAAHTEETPVAAKQEPAAKVAETKPNAAPSQQFQDALQKKLKTVLNHSAKEVHVQFDGAGGAKLRVKVGKLADIEKAQGILQQLPELAGYDVKVEFVVAQ